MSRIHPRPWCRSCRMGPPLGASPPMRMSASWYRSRGIGRIQGCHAKHRGAQGELPSGRMALPMLRLGITSLAPCSPASRTLRAASGGGLRPSLTPAPHAARRSLKSGRRNGPFSQTKKLECTDEINLDRQGPIQGWISSCAIHHLRHRAGGVGTKAVGYARAYPPYDGGSANGRGERRWITASPSFFPRPRRKLTLSAAPRSVPSTQTGTGRTEQC